MGNTNSPFGLRLVGKLGGSSGTISVRRYSISAAEATATFIGDPVSLDVETSVEASGLASPQTNTVDGARYVKRAAGSDATQIAGVIIGFAFDPTNLSTKYRTASTAIDVFVCDDPLALFEVQSDSTGLSVNNMNMNALMTMTAGSTTTGVSKAVLTAPASTYTYPYKIMDYVRAPDNVITTAASPYVRVIVKINYHAYGTGPGTVGV
jgi:hypothetical protein